jgi:hypothetical protein
MNFFVSVSARQNTNNGVTNADKEPLEVGRHFEDAAKPYRLF